MRAAWLPVVLLVGCTYAMEDTRFGTREPETVFTRVVMATQAHCWGVKVADAQQQIVQSKWQAWPTGQGVFLSRCFVSFVRLPDEPVVEVRVSMAMKQCPLADLDDLDALAETCTFTDTVPSVVADQLQLAAAKMAADVRR